MQPMPDYAALVLAGGAGARLGGVDKAEIDVGPATLLRLALDATRSAAVTVVVGPPRDVPPAVRTVSEEPPGGGPVAAVSAGLEALSTADGSAPVVVLACDMPLIRQGDVELLVRELAARPEADAAMYVDARGRRQYLAAAYRRAPLSASIAAEDGPAGASMRAVVARLTVTEVAAHSDLTLDCDTWTDVERTRRVLEDR